MPMSSGLAVRLVLTNSAVYGLVDIQITEMIKVFNDNIFACFEAKSSRDNT